MQEITTQKGDVACGCALKKSENRHGLRVSNVGKTYGWLLFIESSYNHFIWFCLESANHLFMETKGLVWGEALMESKLQYNPFLFIEFPWFFLLLYKFHDFN